VDVRFNTPDSDSTSSTPTSTASKPSTRCLQLSTRIYPEQRGDRFRLTDLQETEHATSSDEHTREGPHASELKIPFNQDATLAEEEMLCNCWYNPRHDSNLELSHR
jgi:hypothetical protein